MAKKPDIQTEPAPEDIVQVRRRAECGDVSTLYGVLHAGGPETMPMRRQEAQDRAEEFEIVEDTE